MTMSQAAYQHADIDKPIASADVAKNFSRSATTYDDVAQIQNQIGEAALGHLPQLLSGNGLDIGAGTGRHTQALNSRGASVQGVDLAKGMVDQAQSLYPEISFSVADAQSLPFSDSSFAFVFSSMALQWCANLHAVAREVERVLVAGGVAELAIMVDGSFTELHKARALASLDKVDTPLPNLQRWISAFQSTNLRVSRVITKDYVDYHPSVLSLLRSIKHAGAGATRQQNASLSKRDLKKLTMAYQGMSDSPKGLPLTYKVSHFRLEK